MKNKKLNILITAMCILTVILVSVVLFVKLEKLKSTSVANNETVFVSGQSIDVLVTDEVSAYDAIDSVSELFGYENAKEEFDILSVDTLDNGDTHYRFNQKKNGIPVYGKTMIVSTDSNGNVFNLNSNYIKLSDDIKTIPEITAEHTKNRIIKEFKNIVKKETVVSKPEIMIYCGDSMPTLVWKLEISGYTDDNEYKAIEFLVDSISGEIIKKSDVLAYYTAATDVFAGQNGEQHISYAYDENGINYMRDDTRKIFVYRTNNNLLLNEKSIDAYTWEEGEEPSAVEVDAMANVAFTYDYFAKTVNHYSTDGYGKNEIRIKTNIGKEKNGKDWIGNAYSKTGITTGGEKVVTIIGVGMKKFFTDYDYAARLDVMAHEYTHGINTCVAGLNSNGQNGALNEAYADIMGECVEDSSDNSTDWIHGSNRNIEKPSESNYPDHMDEYLTEDEIKSRGIDNDEVHYNSTIISHAAFLMWNGANGESSAIKNTKDLAILWYNSLYMLNSESNFSDCRSAVEIAAQRLLSQKILTSDQVLGVSEAFNQVGIDPKITYEIASLNPRLYVYTKNKSDYYNYHYRIDVAYGFIPGGNVNIALSKEYEKDITVQHDVKLDDLKGNARLYRITISDLSDSPGTTQSKFVLVSEKSNNPVEFYTDYISDVDKTRLFGVKLNGKYGFVDAYNNIVIPMDYDRVHEFREGLAYVEKDEKHGYIDKKGKEVIPIKYDGVGNFREGLAYVEKDEKYGFINTSGELVIPIKYDSANSFSNGTCLVRKDEEYILINTKGETVQTYSYKRVSELGGELLKFAVRGVYGERAEEGYLYGIMDRSGKVIVPAKFVSIYRITGSDDLFKVNTNEDNVIENLEYDTNYYEAIMNMDGDLLCEPKYRIYPNCSGNRIAVYYKGKWGFIDTEGTVAIPFTYESASPFNDGLASVKKDGKWGFIDPYGNVAIPIEYEEVGDFQDGLATVKKDGKWGYIDKEGNVIIPIVYDGASWFNEGCAAVKKDGKWGFINERGDIIIPIIYDSVED